MFTIRLSLDDATASRFDRLMDFLEGKQQADIDALVGRMKATRDRLLAVVKTASTGVDLK